MKFKTEHLGSDVQLHVDIKQSFFNFLEIEVCCRKVPINLFYLNYFPIQLCIQYLMSSAEVKRVFCMHVHVPCLTMYNLASSCQNKIEYIKFWLF